MGTGYWALGAGQKQDPDANASFIFFYSLQPAAFIRALGTGLWALARNKTLTRTCLSTSSTVYSLCSSSWRWSETSPEANGKSTFRALS